MVLNDPNIQLPLAIYTKEIISTFSEITDLQPKPKPDVPTITRTGRQVTLECQIDGGGRFINFWKKLTPRTLFAPPPVY